MENERLLTRAEAGITNQLGAHDSILSRARDETLDVGVRDVLDLVEGRVELLVVDSGLVAVVRVLIDPEVEVGNFSVGLLLFSSEHEALPVYALYPFVDVPFGEQVFDELVGHGEDVVDVARSETEGARDVEALEAKNAAVELELGEEAEKLQLVS